MVVEGEIMDDYYWDLLPALWNLVLCLYRQSFVVEMGISVHIAAAAVEFDLEKRNDRVENSRR
jgi:hypothetical protein